MVYQILRLLKVQHINYYTNFFETCVIVYWGYHNEKNIFLENKPEIIEVRLFCNKHQTLWLRVCRQNVLMARTNYVVTVLNKTCWYFVYPINFIAVKSLTKVTILRQITILLPSANEMRKTIMLLILSVPWNISRYLLLHIMPVFCYSKKNRAHKTN